MTDYAIERPDAARRRGLLGDAAVVLAALAFMLWLPAPQDSVLAYVLSPLRMLVLCVLAWWLLRRRGETWGGVGWGRPASLRRAVLLVPLGYLLLGLLAAGLMGLVFPAFDIAPAGSAAAFASIKGDPLKYAYWLAIAWTSAAIGEELLFRGFLQSRLEVAFGGGGWALAGALVVQAAIFGFSHGYQGAGGIMLTSAAGLVLGAVRLAGRGNLAACVGLHALVDTISLTAVFLGALPSAGGA